MKSVMSHNFANTPTINAPRSRFDRSFAHKTTFDAGWLVPYYWDEVLPGDTFNLQSTIFARLATPLFPILDNLYLDTHFFFVPYRLIWENFRKFCGEQDNPGDSIDFQIPILSGTETSDGNPDLTVGLGQRGALLNYIGVPHGVAPNDIDISALPFRAYNLIYNEWFRDQNLINSIPRVTDDGPDAVGIAGDVVGIQRRGKRHDYFTSALTAPQRGDAVSLPLGTTAPVQATSATPLNTPTFQDVSGSGNTDRALYTTAGGSAIVFNPANTGNNEWAWDEPNLEANLTTATAATVNDLREAFQVQKLLERDARSGTRYSELVRNHFGVDFYDVSYRPEYLGGGSTPVNINPVAVTAESSLSTPTGIHAGDLTAFGTAAVRGHGFTKSFVEHGIVMGMVSVRADLTYQQGLNRHLSKSTRYDLYWPSLAHLGEQEILNKEIYVQGTAADDEVFGYQERYAEYRYKNSMISGLFQSVIPTSLDSWHLSQEFSSLPILGKTFIEESPPLDRCIKVDSEPHFIMDSYNKLLCARPMPVFGVPGMIDHF